MKTEYFIIASILGSGIGSFLYKFATNSMQPLMVAAISLCTYAVLLPIAFVLTKTSVSATPSGVFYAVISSVFLCIGTLGVSYALRNGEAVGKISAIAALYPALTLVLSCIFLGETITIKKIIGVALALIAVAILI